MNAPLNPYAALPPEAVRWLANGRRGVSSNSFISAVYGIDAVRDGHRDAPHDPSDFRRCRLMVDAIPGAKEQLLSLVDIQAYPRPRLAMLKVVENWELMCAVMDAEVPEWRDPPRDSSSPRLYRFMQQLWAEVDAHLATLPEDERTGPVQGRDLQDYMAAVERRGSQRQLKAQVKSLMEMPVVESKLNGRAAFALLQEARAVIERMTAPDAEGGSNDLAEAANDALKMFADPRCHKPPRGKADESAVRHTLQKAMDFLWRESRVDAQGGSNDYAEGVYEDFARLSRLMSKATEQALQPATPTAASSPTRKAQP
jgi:hypothetical protein